MRWVVVGAGVILAFGCRQGLSLVGSPQDDGGVPPITDGGPDPNTSRWPPPRTGYTNPIPAENQLRGDPAWNRGFSNPWAHSLK